MLNIMIKASNMELTNAIQDYAEKRLLTLEKFMKNAGEQKMDVELSQTTKHHKQGAIYRAEVNLIRDGKRFYSFSEKEDLYTAIDDVREEVERQLIADKDRNVTLFRRGARSIKKMLRGLSRRNPFTSK